jgi:hypothetical protein
LAFGGVKTEEVMAVFETTSEAIFEASEIRFEAYEGCQTIF